MKLAVWLIVMALAAPAFAQAGRQQGRVPPRQQDNRDSRGAQPADDLSPAQLHQLFDAMLVMQAQNALSLNDQQYAQFVTRVKSLQDVRRRNQQERMRVINELQRLTNPRNPKPAAEADVTPRLEALQEIESRAAGELRRAYDGVDEVLNPLQRARFRVLEEQIERRKLELVGRARNRPNQKR